MFRIKMKTKMKKKMLKNKMMIILKRTINNMLNIKKIKKQIQTIQILKNRKIIIQLCHYTNKQIDQIQVQLMMNYSLINLKNKMITMNLMIQQIWIIIKKITKVKTRVVENQKKKKKQKREKLSFHLMFQHFSLFLNMFMN